MIAMAIRGCAGVDGEKFGLIFFLGALAISANIPRESTADRLPVRRLRHQRHQVVCDPIGSVTDYRALLKVIA